ncbi:MAG: condensation domain-containing protein, partial [Desulfobacterales bacterium]|nr:condensation domain-containing protein [Desulfobacterales bacterium]
MSHNIDVSQMSRAQKQAMLKALMERKKQKDSYYPLSSGQKGLWFLQKMNPESYAYNVPCAFSLNGTVDADALNRAIHALADHRTILRTVLKTDASGEPLQSVAYKKPVDVEVRSISQLAEFEIEPFLRQIAHEPFDLETGPLFRVYLFTRSETQAILLFNFHHIIFDGSSLPLFVNDLTAMYRAALAGDQSEVSPPEASFADYVHWQRDMLAGEEGTTHKTYWLDKLAGDLPVLNLPEDMKPGSGDGDGGCDTYRMDISAELSQSLRKVAEDHRVYLFTVLLGAFQVLLHRYTEQDDIITGIPMAGRNRTEFEELIGYFINMVPIRADLSEEITFADLMQQLHKAGMEALTHQEYPFPEMVKSLRETGLGGSSDTPL